MDQKAAFSRYKVESLGPIFDRVNVRDTKTGFCCRTGYGDGGVEITVNECIHRLRFAELHPEVVGKPWYPQNLPSDDPAKVDQYVATLKKQRTDEQLS